MTKILYFLFRKIAFKNMTKSALFDSRRMPQKSPCSTPSKQRQKARFDFAPSIHATPLGDS